MAEQNTFEKDLFEFVFRIQDHMRTVVRGKDADLSPIQLLILRTLFETGEIPQRDLVARLSRDKSQIARLIKDLEAKGLVKRRLSPNDGRVYLVQAVEHVRKTVERFVANEKRLVDKITQDLTHEEAAVLKTALAKANDALKRPGSAK